MEAQQGRTLRLHGELDEETCSAVRRELAPALAAGLRHLVLDLTGVAAVRLDGLRLLRSLDRHLRRRGGALLVVHATDEVERALRTYELAGLLELRDVRPPAVSRTRPPRPAERVAPVVPLVRRA
jgi:anti-anti-sigma factor